MAVAKAADIYNNFSSAKQEEIYPLLDVHHRSYISFGFVEDYARKVTITEQSGSDLTDYQVLIELNSTNFDFSHTQTNGEDIRFTDASGNLLDYWIESWDAVSERAKVWVKVPSIPANGTVEIWMYYGNSEITDASDGYAVFEFFDDFDDLNGWSIGGGSPEPYVSGGVLILPGDTTDRYIYRSLPFFDGYAWEIKIQKQGDGTKYAAQAFKWWSGGTEIYRVGWHADNSIWIRDLVDSEEIITGTRVEDTEWHTIKVTRLSNGDWALYFDDELIGTANDTTSTSTDTFGIGSAENIDVYYDDIRIRKYTSPEPSASLGAEETA